MLIYFRGLVFVLITCTRLCQCSVTCKITTVPRITYAYLTHIACTKVYSMCCLHVQLMRHMGGMLSEQQDPSSGQQMSEELGCHAGEGTLLQQWLTDDHREKPSNLVTHSNKLLMWAVIMSVPKHDITVNISGICQ